MERLQQVTNVEKMALLRHEMAIDKATFDLLICNPLAIGSKMQEKSTCWRSTMLRQKTELIDRDPKSREGFILRFQDATDDGPTTELATTKTKASRESPDHTRVIPLASRKMTAGSQHLVSNASTLGGRSPMKGSLLLRFQESTVPSQSEVDAVTTKTSTKEQPDHHQVIPHTMSTQTQTRQHRETADADPHSVDYCALPRPFLLPIAGTKTATFAESEKSDTDPDPKKKFRIIP